MPFLYFFLGSAADAGQEFIEAHIQLRKNRPAQALRIFEIELQSNSNLNPWTYYYMGEAARQSGDTDLAIDCFRKAAAIPDPFIAFSAVRAAIPIVRDDVGPYAAAANLLEFAEDRTFGAEALFRTGQILLHASDTPTALKMWRDLMTQYNTSPFSHSALLRILDLDTNLIDQLIATDNYLAFAMAQTAYQAEDYSSSRIILESVERRPIDRRIRESLLLLQANVLYRLSDYEKAVAYFHESARRSNTAGELIEARLGTILSELQMGDTVEPLISLYRISPASLSPAYRENLMNVAAIRQIRGETATAKAIWAHLKEPSFEEFLRSFDNLAELTTAPVSAERLSSEYWSVLRRAESLWNKTDRALAIALLAELGGKIPAASPRDLWRIVIYDSTNDFLVAYASGRLSERVDYEEEESGRLFSAALEEIESGDPEIGFRRLRLVAFGYPSSRAAKSAHEKLRSYVQAALCLGPSACGVPSLKTMWAWEMIQAGVGGDAADWLAESRDARSVSLAAKGYHASGDHRAALRMLALLRLSFRWPVPWEVFPESVFAQAFPLPYSDVFFASADSYGIDPALLFAIAREETKFDPTYHSAFRLGITALPVEAPLFAEEFQNAPRITTVEMLDPRKSVPLEAWYLKKLSQTLRTDSAARVAAAKHAGLANIPPAADDRSLLDFVARIPFRKSREHLLSTLYAVEVYKKRAAVRDGR